MKKATKKPEDHFPGLQEFMDRLPEIVALIKPEPPPPVPYAPYKPPPDRWVFGKHMAVDLTQLLEGADSVELCWEKTYKRGREGHVPVLVVHRGKRFENLRLEDGMIGSTVSALQECFPDWLVFWPEMPSETEPAPKPQIGAAAKKALKDPSRIAPGNRKNPHYWRSAGGVI
jgi:hypothetical protein